MLASNPDSMLNQIFGNLGTHIPIQTEIITL
ncbi:hypothetical protein FBZ86_1701 [Gluconacetobacter diazotrophicus]|nr:hypothetical protein FBZ86_1851 [Gluconacetobacter diazotrophicus]TWA97894.1 hypothetical protein FBZ86_1701 [Gluconacetobacter diazotrophicus]